MATDDSDSRSERDNHTLDVADCSAESQSRPSRLPLLVATLVLVLGLAVLLRGKLSDATKHRAVGQTISIGSLTPLVETQSPLDSDGLSGKVSLLHFWGTWCGPCRMEYPELVELYNETQADPNFRFVSVSCGGYPGQSFTDVQQQTSEYYQTNGFSIPTYTDPEGFIVQSVAETLQQDGLMFPTSILVGPKGTVLAVWQGYHPSGVKEMRSLIDTLAVK